MRVVVADDHPLYRDAAVQQIQRLFSHARIDQVSSLDELRALAEQADTAFHLFLVDFHMPGMSVEALGELVKRFPQVPIAVISGTAHRAEIRAMLQAGARGFIPKTATGDHLAHALQMLLAGGTSVPAEMLFDGPGGDMPSVWQDLLTQRERDVLRGVVRGLSNKEIGRELNLAEVTIKLHLRGVFRKMGARGRADAAVIATRAGFA
jgi:two-component system, NarL family, nitrate/nitrite response regulator NarL